MTIKIPNSNISKTMGSAFVFLRDTIRFFTVLLPGFLGLFLIVRAFAEGHVSNITYGLWLLLIFALVTYFVPVHRVETHQTKRRFVIKLAGLLLPIALIFPLTVVVLIFGKTDMAAFVFHFVFGIENAPIAFMIPYVITVLIYWGVILGTMYRMRHWLGAIPFWASICFIGVLAGNPLVHDLLLNRFQAKYVQRATLLPEFSDPKLIADNAGPNPDVIIIYLEGLERTYAEQDSFKDIYSPLTALASEGVEFTNVDQIFATSWSLAGIVASQCGTPLLPLGARPQRRLADVQWITPQITCFTDILKARGYHSTYVSTAKIIGDKMSYSGFDNFFSSHNVDQIIDTQNAMTPNAINARATGGDHSWGLRDRDAFDIASSHITDRLKSPQPYFLMMSTMDTHGPKAYMSPECLTNKQPNISTDLADAVACSSALTVSFVEKIRTLTKGRDTRIVIASDHLAHHNNLFEDLSSYDRRNTLILLGGDISPRKIDKAGSMIDVYPTLLDWLGWLQQNTISDAGLGRSLLNKAPTLIQQSSLKDVNDRLRVDVELARFIWRQTQ